MSNRYIIPDHVFKHVGLPVPKKVTGLRGQIAGFLAKALPQKPHKEVALYDMENKEGKLPGVKLCEEDLKARTRKLTPDEVLAATYTDICHEFWATVFERYGMDGKNTEIKHSCHYGVDFNNAYFNGDQFVCGDGDGETFLPFMRSLDVIGHELGHWVVQSGPNLRYFGEPGALNEHFADVYGSVIKQWHSDHDFIHADWLIGNDIVGPKFPGKALRTFRNEAAYDGDPQPKNMNRKYRGFEDNGGVHINSGIPNHAFYLVCRELHIKNSARSWQTPINIWFKAMMVLKSGSNFKTMAKHTIAVAAHEYGVNSEEAKAVRFAWEQVGVKPAK